MAVITSEAKPRAGSSARRWLPMVGVVGFVAVLAYLVVLPLIRLQTTALENGAQGYRTAFGAPGIGDVLLTTAQLALGSFVIAMVLGTLLAWASTQLPPRFGWMRSLPVLPIVIPAVANVIGWAFLLSPRPGYLNALLRELPWWNHLEEGPIDVYTVPWIIIITGFSLAAFVYLFVSAGLKDINQEHVEAAQVAGSSRLGVFFKVVLPLLRPSLIYGGGVALLLGLGQFTAPLLLGTAQGVDVITTEIFRYVSESPTDFAAAAAMGSPLLVFGLIVVIGQKIALGDQRRFVTHGGKGFRSSGQTSKLAAVGMLLYAFLSTVLPIAALTVVALSKFWTPTISPGDFTLDNVREVLSASDTRDAIITSIVASAGGVILVLIIGFITASLLLRGQQFKFARTLLDFIVALPLGVPAVIFGVGFLLTYSVSAARPVRLDLGDRPRLHGADAAVRHADAARDDDRDGQRLPGGLACQRRRPGLDEHEDRAPTAPCEHGRRGGADVRAAHARVLGLDARPLTDHERDGHGVVRLLDERLVPDRRRDRPGHDRGHRHRCRRRDGVRRARCVRQAVSRRLDVGDEPDPRFTLANERTFLAWARTALGALVAGLAVAELLGSEPQGERLALSIPLIVIAGVIGVLSYPRWRTLERALRLRRPLPYSPALGP